MKRTMLRSLQVMLMAVLLLLTMVGKPAIAQGGTSVNTLLNDYTVAVATATVRTQKSNYALNEPIIVEYSGFPGNTNDWITISSPSKPDNSYGQYFYTQGKLCGTRSFKSLPAGNYEVRGYFNWSAGGYTIQTRSNFTVGQITSIQPEPQPVTQNCPQDNLIQPKPEPTPIAKPEPTPVAKPEPTPIAKPEPTPIAKPEPNPCDPNKPIPGAFSSIRIGDFDGFGFKEGQGLKAAYGGTINVDGTGTLSTGDFLPDFNGDSKISNRDAGDPFDNRSDAEVAGTFVTGSGFEDMGSKGVDYTDLSLGKVFGYKTSSTYGRPFPDSDPNTLPNTPGFKFRFKVAKDKLPEGTSLYLNVMLGDYDVEPAQVILKNGKGQSFTKELTASAKSEKDGIIQAAYLPLDFSQVFTDGNTSGEAGYWVGSLDVNFDAPQEPYLSFDFAEIGTHQILLTPCPKS